MKTTPEQLLARLEGLGIATTTHRHIPVYTVEEAKAACGHLPGGHCKNLFLKDGKGVFWLLVALEDTRIDLKVARRRIGSAPLSFARPEALMDVLGVEPGSVTPFAIVNDAEGRVRVVLDRAMLTRHPLNYHPLTNAATTAITAADLVAFVRACGREPQIADLSADHADAPAPGP